MSRRHVVLLTYGEPPRPGFFAQLRYSWRILIGLTRAVADIPAPLLPVIALARAFTRVATWRRERFESPLESLTHAQAEGLTAALTAAAPGVGWTVHVAYEFRDPTLGGLLARLPAGERVDVVPMYAIDSAFTHQLARDAIAASTVTRPLRVLPALPTEELGELGARHVRGQMAGVGFRPGPDTALVLAAHGTLLDPPRPFETGRAATEALAVSIARRLEGTFGTITLAWLNHRFGGRWTEPAANRALRQVAAGGFQRVVYFPFGFLADNAESLLEGRQALRAEPGLAALHLPCWNAAPDLMAALADHVLRPDPPRPALGDESAGRVVHPPRRDRGRRERRLDQLEPGEHSVIRRLEGDSGLERRLMELGLTPGTPVEVVRRAPFGDPVEIRVREVSLSLRRTETRRIHVGR